MIGPDPSDGFSGIQSALDEIDQAGGGVLDLHENATYEYDSTVRLEVPDNVLIKGNGATLLGNGDETTDGHVVPSVQGTTDTLYLAKFEVEVWR